MTAFGLRKTLSLTTTLAVSDFKLRYAGSALGYFWSVAKPLMLFGVLYVVFSEMLRFGEGIEHYPLQLLLAIVLWAYFSETTGAAVSVLVARADMIRKIAFPRVVLPISVGLTAFLAMLFNLVAVFAFILASGVDLRPSWLILIALIAELWLFTLGVSLIISTLFVRFRDIGQLWQVGLQMLFYATPVIWPIQLLDQRDVPEWLQRAVLCNPLAQIIEDARHATISAAVPPVSTQLGHYVVIPYAVVVLVLLLGLVLYRTMTPRMAEHL